MRNLSFALTAFLLFALSSCGPTYVVQSPAPAPPPAAPAPEDLSYQNFYDALSPYGEWVNNPEYGYVWMPNAGPDFKPYVTNGNWVYTDEGWAWNSDYAWGWAPFHYGRWFFEDGYGWMWIPGNDWAPAWVTWRRSPDYYGWAPLGPNVSITVAAEGGYNPPPHYWCFVPHQYVTNSHVNNYYVNERENVTIINNTTVIHNTTVINNTTVNNNVNRNRGNTYSGGPDPGEVSRFTGNQLRPVTVRETNTPGGNSSGGVFAVYRPRVNPAPQGNGGNSVNSGSSFHPAPARAQNLNSVRPVNTTMYNNRGSNNNTTVNNPVNNNPTQPANQPQQGNPAPFPPNRQPFGQPVNQRQQSGQPANQGQPAGQSTNQGQPAAQSTGQPGNTPGLHPNNTRFVPGAGTSNGNPALKPSNNPGPAVNQHPGQTANHPATGNANGNNGNRSAANPPKPRSQQGPKPDDTQRKPKPNNPDNRQ